MANSTNKALIEQSRQFAENLRILLNNTVCDSATIAARIAPDQHHAIVGTQLTGITAQPVRMRSAAASPIWLDVMCRLNLDEDEGTFLTIQASVCSLLVGDEKIELLHYDYERNKARYTEAHIQVNARHEAFERHLAETRKKGINGLNKIHLPVGGRRFRPALEDLLECLIVEDLVAPKNDWETTLNQSRDRYRRKQAAAVVRRDPTCAVEELERLGYQVSPPGDANRRTLLDRLVRPRQRGDVPDGERQNPRNSRRRR